MATREEICKDLAQRIRRIERSSVEPLATLSPPLDVSGEPIRFTNETDRSSAGRLWQHWLIDPASLRGSLIEWLSDGAGSGRTSLALWGGRSVVPHGLWVVVDSSGEWYAPGFNALELDLRQTVLIRPKRQTEVLWSVEQALRTRGVGAVVCEIENLSSAVFRRLQLAAEAGGSLGILLRSEQARHQPSWAEYRFLVRPLAPARLTPRTRESTTEEKRGKNKGPENNIWEMEPLLARRRLWVELLRARGQISGNAAIVELDDAADSRLCLVAQMAAATTPRRAAGA